MFGEYSFQKREFDGQVSASSRDYNIHVPVIGFEHAISPTLSLRAQFGYFWQIPQRGSNETGPVYDILLRQQNQRTTFSLNLQGGYTEDYYSAENLGFARYHQAIGMIAHQLTQRTSTTLSARYQRPKYNDGRTDDIWGVSGRVSCQWLRWLTPYLDLSYSEDHSNRPTNDYADFRAMVGIRATY